ncbi:MAG: bacillithiol system redox-active protein YtxJ [Gemmatimonadaceae bacterium]|nr:bacillithiol system redox-active protein YtxJ [Gemmatimonadaceae bacterium]
MSDYKSLAEVTDATFAAEVLESPVPVLVDVWAGWCTPCLTLTPVINRLAEKYHGRVRVFTLDADQQLETVTRYDVRALPTVLIFHGGALVSRQSGAQSYGTYVTQLDAVLEGTGATERLPHHDEAGTTHHAAADAQAATPEMVEARTLADSEQTLVIFKHSATCPISVWVKQHYDRFVADHPDVPTRLVVVQQERALSNAIESHLQVQHESPQAIVVRRGQVLWHASHRRITADGIAQALGQ